MSNTIQLVRDKHVIVPKHDLVKLAEEAELLIKRKETVLPVEQATLGMWMQQRAWEIQTAVNECEVSALTGKPILDQSVLRWRHGGLVKRCIPVPVLAMIDPFNSDTMTLGDRDHYSMRGVITHNYQDVQDGCTTRARKIEGRCRISFTWKGVLPNEIRDLIHQERSSYDRIHLLVNSPKDQWKYQQELNPRPRHIDPLVLGEIKGQLVLLGQFDPTPLEQYVSSEFTARQLTA